VQPYVTQEGNYWQPNWYMYPDHVLFPSGLDVLLSTCMVWEKLTGKHQNYSKMTWLFTMLSHVNVTSQMDPFATYLQNHIRKTRTPLKCA